MTPSPRTLYPPTEPFNRFRLPVSGGHDLYVEECGTPGAKPALVLHGGPGGGCSPGMRRYFDPEAWHVALFDQRGCGRSRPLASVETNTTWTLIEDIEAIRRRLGLESWTVFGGSWGAALGLLYAQAHPRRVDALVLRGVFLSMREELDWFYGGGAGRFFPEIWADFIRPIPEAERDDLIAAYHRRLMSGDVARQSDFARSWVSWESSTATLRGPAAMRGVGGSPSYLRAFARIECHYFHNGGFLERDDQILANAEALRDIPGLIAQGRYDMICPPASAYRLTQLWPRAQLRLVPDAGHALSEPGIIDALISATDALRDPAPARRRIAE